MNRYALPGTVLALVAFAFAPAAAETYDLHIYPYCAPGDLCDFSSESAMQLRMLQQVQEMNVVWEVTGISFRPTIFPIDTSDPNFYLTTGCWSSSGKECSNGDRCTTDSDCSGSCDCVGPDCVCESDLTTACSHDSQCSGSCDDIARLRRVRWRKLVAETNPNAISMMITKGRNTCCSNVANETKPYDALFGIWCDANRSVLRGGTIWAHEMGHHWCLPHTFTKLDFLDSMPSQPDHDLDDAVGILDTPPDACLVETDDRAPECFSSGISCTKDSDCGTLDFCDKAIFNLDRDFCGALKLIGVTDDDSPHASRCNISCSRCGGNDLCGNGHTGTLSPLNLGTEGQHIMSYFDEFCVGPYVSNGQRTEGLSSDSLSRIQFCQTNVTNRNQLPDVCFFNGNDNDNDGWCDFEDNCPLDKNTDQVDGDGDGDGDACDLCPMDPGPTGDIDDDGIGDACDDDMDGDDCLNWEDRRPTEGLRRTGSVSYIGCAAGGQTFYKSEGENSDTDMILDCWDVDDDDDGICDDGQAYGPNPADGTILGCTAGPDPCPTTGAAIVCDRVEPGPPCPPLWDVCLGSSGCVEYLIHIYELINPADKLVIDTFAIWNETIYMIPPIGMTASQVALGAGGGLAGGGAAESTRAGATLYRMEMVRRDSGEVVAIIADDYSSADVIYREYTHGPFVRVKPGDGAGPVLEIDTTYQLGRQAGDRIADQDEDGRPDGWDNCTTGSNFDQTDADADGFGNVCDADLNNDDLVTDADLDAVTLCVGADLDLSDPIGEPEFEPGFDIGGFEDGFAPEPLALDMADDCAAADLNDDRIVDAIDVGIARSLLGSPPGPSGPANLSPIANAGPDQSPACGTDTVLDASDSSDPEGAPLTCNWSAATCTIDDATACTTVAACPDGNHTVSLVVNDGLFNSTADELQVNVACVPPGATPTTMTMTRQLDATGGLELVFNWAPSCESGAVDYAIYEGELGVWYSHEQADCSDDNGDFTEVLSPRSGNTYYVVVPLTATSEGSYGESRPAVERPPASVGVRCLAIQTLSSCP
jgi:hypothetical protein